ncbi:unnamed protein product [Rhizopus microsporus]
MEILRHQFLDKLPEIEKAIKECDVIAIDTELSGLHRPLATKRLYSLQERYEEYKEATERFVIIQFGLCTFTWDSAGRYIAKPFNFYIFPTSATGTVHTNRLFMTQAQAFDFLVKQSFDFNKWVYQGIPYLTREEEELHRKEAARRIKDDIPDIPLDDKEVPFMQNVRKMIDEWLEDSQRGEGVNIVARNAYQRRLVYQEVRNKYEDLTAIGMQGFIRVTKLTKEQQETRMKERLEKIERDCTFAVGFRKVIDMISESGKMIVGHNMLLDVSHMIAQFVQPLPETLEEFKTLAHKLFPNMIDTKYMCAVEPELYKIFGTATALEQLRFETSREAFTNPRIDMHPLFPRYLTEKAHEAGYDAFITGSAFLKLASYLEQLRYPLDKIAEEPQIERKTKVDKLSDDEQNNWYEDGEDEEIYNYGSTRVNLFLDAHTVHPALKNSLNKSVLVRSAFDCFDFVNDELVINQTTAFHVQSVSGHLDMDKAKEVFIKAGKHVLERYDSSTCFLVFEQIPQHFDLEQYKDEFIITPIAQYYENMNMPSSK